MRIESSVKWSAIENAASICRRHTLSDPIHSRREYGVIVHARTGEIIGEQQGERHLVDFKDLAAKVVGNIIVHSHPDATPLSPQDISMATSAGGVVVAVGTDGSLYSSKGWNKGKIDGPPHVAFLEQTVLQPRSAFIYQKGNGAFTRTESTFLGLHATFREWAAKDWLSYDAILTPDQECVWSHGRDWLLSHNLEVV